MNHELSKNDGYAMVIGACDAYPPPTCEWCDTVYDPEDSTAADTAAFCSEECEDSAP